MAAQDIRLRQRLSSYDDTGAIVGALRELGGVGGDEAAFLRAAVTTDLLLLGELTGDEGLSQRVGAAVGSDAPRVWARDALRRVRRGMYAEPARDFERALAVLDGAELGERTGLRWDVLFVHRVVAALRDGTAVPRGHVVEREGVSADARARLGALRDAGAALRRLQRAGTEDPLVARLEHRLHDWAARLSEARVPLAMGAVRGVAIEGGQSVSVDAVLVVGASSVGVGHAGALAVNERGQVVEVEARGARYPETSAMGDLTGLSLGVVAEEGVRFDRLAEVLKQAREAGARRFVAMADGAPRGVELRFEGSTRTDVSLRNSGIRVEGASIAYRDLARVSEHVRRGPVRLMPRRSIAVKDVLAVAIAAAGDDGFVVLRLP